MNVADDVSDDAFLGGRLRLQQPRKGHRAGHDAILLAAATAARPGERVVEFGAGVGAAGLALARRVPGITLALVERDERLAALARSNAARNGLAATVVVLDVAAEAVAFAGCDLWPDSADRVLMNPPFNDSQRHRPSPDTDKRAAHEAGTVTLDIWTHAARRVLRPGGTLTLIWRAEGLAAVLGALSRGFGGVKILPVHPRPDAPAIRVLVRAEKGSRAPMLLLPGLVLNDAAGCPAPFADAVLRGEETLPLARD
ncbi:MAG: methyltransferase [Xanthobacteraceae bacterium]